MELGSADDLRRRFRTGRPCLDLVHTGGEGALAQWEIVDTPDDLGRLLGVILGLAPVPASDPPGGQGPRVPVDPPRPDDVAIVNAAAAVPPLTPALLPAGGTAVV